MAQVLQGRHRYSFRISAEDLVNVHCKEAKHLNVGAAGLQGTPLMISRGSVFASEIMAVAVAAAAPIPCFFGTPTAPKHMFYEHSHNLCSPRATRFKSGRRLACTPPPVTYQADSDSSELQESADDQIAKLMAANKSLLARIAELESLLRTRISMEDAPNIASLVKQSSTEIQELPGSEESLSQEDIGGCKESEASHTTMPKTSSIQWPSPDNDVPFWKKDFSKKKAASLEQSELEEAGSSSSQVIADNDIAYIIHVTAEMAPLAKVGGLGDVVTGLARACIGRGHKVEVMLPFYEAIARDQIEDLVAVDSYSSYHRGEWVPIQLYRGNVSGVPVLFLEPKNNRFFKGTAIYGGSYDDELEAYLFFSRACLEWMQITGCQPDIIHVHEWQTSAVAMLYWDMYHHLSLKRPRLVFTIHNIEHFGECRVEQLDMCGLDGQSYRSIEKAIDERTVGHNPERLSLLKGAIVYSNAITTVSPTYMNETLCSGWISATLLKYRSKYSGVLNGIDTVMWDPAKDPYLPFNFDAKDLVGKQFCKHYIQRGLGLEFNQVPMLNPLTFSQNEKRTPLVVCITRLVPQKGIHLIRHAILHVAELGGQFILLGTSPNPSTQSEFQQLANHVDKTNVRLMLTYSEALAHMLYAAADIVLLPSIFEPCGLTQMIGMRYGAIPLVRRTGGLADTVFDVDDQSKQDCANGFVFDGLDEGSLSSTLERAMSYYQQRPDWWLELTSKAMELDNSWDKSAGEYLSLYQSVRVR
ncbi:unnamed protein product [Sphagnum jensenii]|uniref:Starch synthase, chloroplastic/amyloplastic n=1 Tax=Sphagnum jensenii TaxID=128206 RepID=A0ABP1AQJ2_9BRYO